MPTERDALRLVTAIHGAALDPAGWQAVAAEINNVIGCGAVAVHAIDEASRLTFPIGVDGFDPGYIDSYLSHYGAISPWPEKFLSMPRGRARHSFSDLPLESYLRTEFYQDWMRPQENRVASVGIRTSGAGHRSILATVNLRRRDRDRLEAPALRLLNRMHLDLTHAAAVNDVIARLSAQTLAGLAQAGDGPEGGIFIVSDDQILLWADAGGIGLLGTLVRTTGLGRVSLTDPGAQNWFEATLAALRHRGEVGASLTCRLPDRSGAAPWTVRAVRCDGASPLVPYVSSETRSERRALALVFDRAKLPASPVDRLRQRYGLTVAEAEVALRLAEGLSTEEIALQRKASRNTVRNQVQALLWKMEARSRGDVIRIVSRLLETGGG